jgi:hypothetical protein
MPERGTETAVRSGDEPVEAVAVQLTVDVEIREQQRRPVGPRPELDAHLVVAVLVILMVLLTAGVLLTGDAPVDELLPPEPGVEYSQE